ncbi:MAG TPA: YciI family protein [Vicinamibacterales bacterium]|nr:YciI family protein [Vicinamibacterales bacterium]
MKYLALIYLNEDELAAMPARELSDLNARHLDFNDGLRANGKFIVAEALAPSQETARISKRGGKLHITDGPFTEAKEVVAGFYLIDANDMKEAVDIASRIPSAGLGVIDVRPCRQLIVEGRPLRWG